MASLPFSRPNKNVSHDDDLYCSDPNCPYCKDLALAEELWKRAREEQAKRADAA
jgi:hypothetical protein